MTREQLNERAIKLQGALEWLTDNKDLLSQSSLEVACERLRTEHALLKTELKRQQEAAKYGWPW